MVVKIPFGFLFSGLVVLGTVLAMSASHVLAMWVGLEINMMGIVPMLIFRSNRREKDSGMTYFIVQTFGSGLFLLGSIGTFSLTYTWDAFLDLDVIGGGAMIAVLKGWCNWGIYLIVISLLLKLGAFPFHFWIPRVITGSSWGGCLLLTTWQKIAPVFLLSSFISSHFPNSSNLLVFLVVVMSMSSLIGGYGGMNQTQVRAILAYSSIGHIGWMVFCIMLGKTVLVTYMLVYLSVTLCLFVVFWWCDGYSLKVLGSLAGRDDVMFNQVCVITMLLSLGGLPMTLGFYGKFMAISYCYMMSTYSSFILIFLVGGSLLSLYYYLSLLFSAVFYSAEHVVNRGIPRYAPPVEVEGPSLKGDFSVFKYFSSSPTGLSRPQVDWSLVLGGKSYASLSIIGFIFLINVNGAIFMLLAPFPEYL